MYYQFNFINSYVLSIYYGPYRIWSTHRSVQRWRWRGGGGRSPSLQLIVTELMCWVLSHLNPTQILGNTVITTGTIERTDISDSTGLFQVIQVPSCLSSNSFCWKSLSKSEPSKLWGTRQEKDSDNWYGGLYHSLRYPPNCNWVSQNQTVHTPGHLVLPPSLRFTNTSVHA